MIVWLPNQNISIKFMKLIKQWFKTITGTGMGIINEWYVAEVLE